jgi:2'-5' RNA ligase
MRAFIAVNLPDEVKKEIAEATASLKKIDSGIKWVEPQNLHLTLKFLGWVEDMRLPEVVEITGKLTSPSFKLKLAGVGCFPEGKSPRVLWVDIKEGAAELKALADRLEEDFSSAGFRAEEREFSPHLTIGRIKDKRGIDKVIEEMGKLAGVGFGECVIQNIEIMKSTLSREGPIYEVYKSCRLGKSPSTGSGQGGK